MQQHIHIIGIGGTFMGGLAALALSAGFRVTGCDAKMYPPMSTQLAELGIDVYEGFSAEQLDTIKADKYVIGNVAKRGMPIIEAILNQQLPYISGPQWLAEHILHKTSVLAVAGTHGKTTTASMLAWVLEYAGLGAGFLIGGIPQNFSVSARLPTFSSNDGQRPFFVIEADEYDTAFFDKRSKFVHYRPKVAILNNLEYDHADIFADLNAIQTQFHHLVRTIPSAGLLVVNAQEQSLQQTLARGCWTPIDYFGDDQGWHIGQVADDGAFEVCYQGQKQAVIAWNLLGEHNRMNALAVIAVAKHIGIELSTICAALSEFKNVKRRMEIKGMVNGVTIYDDFAHHPTAIATTIAGLRQKVGKAKIIAVLEPRSNTMKLGTMKAMLAESLSQADEVFCYTGGVDWDVQAALKPLADKVHCYAQLDELVIKLVQHARKDSHILIMSNGGFGGIHQKILDKL